MAKKRGRPHGPQDEQRTETKDPERAADAIVQMTQNRLDRFQELAEASNMHPSLMQAIMRRMDGDHPQAMAELRKLGHGELVDALDEKISLLVQYIDPYSVGKASLKDIAIALGIIIEKKQLLEGRPTAILSIEDRRHIKDLLPVLVKEATRRGITIDQTPDEVTRTILPEIPQTQALSATARRFPDPPVEVSLE